MECSAHLLQPSVYLGQIEGGRIEGPADPFEVVGMLVVGGVNDCLQKLAVAPGAADIIRRACIRAL